MVNARVVASESEIMPECGGCHEIKFPVKNYLSKLTLRWRGLVPNRISTECTFFLVSVCVKYVLKMFWQY